MFRTTNQYMISSFHLETSTTLNTTWKLSNLVKTTLNAFSNMSPVASRKKMVRTSHIAARYLHEFRDLFNKTNQ
jgi:hypothetical protein